LLRSTTKYTETIFLDAARQLGLNKFTTKLTHKTFVLDGKIYQYFSNFVLKAIHHMTTLKHLNKSLYQINIGLFLKNYIKCCCVEACVQVAGIPYILSLWSLQLSDTLKRTKIVSLQNKPYWPCFQKEWNNVQQEIDNLHLWSNVFGTFRFIL